jgi:hypothetical protein
MIRGKVDGRMIHEQSTAINQDFSNPERRRRQPRVPKYSSIPPFLPYFQSYSAATLRQVSTDIYLLSGVLNTEVQS